MSRYMVLIFVYKTILENPRKSRAFLENLRKSQEFRGKIYYKQAFLRWPFWSFSKRPIRGPMKIAPTKAAIPPTACTLPPITTFTNTIIYRL